MKKLMLICAILTVVPLLASCAYRPYGYRDGYYGSRYDGYYGDRYYSRQYRDNYYGDRYRYRDDRDHYYDRDYDRR